MLGFFGAVTELVPHEARRQAVESSVPEGTEELNLKAFDKGYQYGVELKEKTAKTGKTGKGKTKAKQKAVS